jgi:serine phosphatase RsbU (regulator of sigma subunit)
MRRLLASFSRIFDLDTRIDGARLGDLAAAMLDELDEHPRPDWGTPGDAGDLEIAGEGAVRFAYRPHLFPGMDEELRLAHRLQFHLLPRELPPEAPFSVAAVLESYCHLSGDLFGWAKLRGGDFLLWIVDMAGHGVRAGLCSAVVRILVERAHRRGNLEALLGALNASLARALLPEHDNLFATAFFATIGGEGRMAYASAGHPPVLVRRRRGVIEELASTGLPLAIHPDEAFAARHLVLDPGDALLLYTDGLVESPGPDDEPLGLGRVQAAFAPPFAKPEEVTDRIYRVVAERQDLARLQDDLTFLVARMN